MRRLVNYFRQVGCSHTIEKVAGMTERIEDERSLGLVRYTYNTQQEVCSKCGWVKAEKVDLIPNNL
jgi:hypothetical protein